MKAKPKANTKTPVADKSSEKENKILREELDRASAFVQEIKSGNLAATYTSLLAKHPLGESLLLLRNQMAALLTQEQQRNWLNEGLARFAEILRKRQQESLPMLMNEVLSQLVRYVGATQGILSVLLEEDGKSFLQSVSHYAAEKKIKDVRKFDLGEGLTGEVMITRKEIYLEKIPRGYLTISSGLGKSAPVSVLVMPLLLDTEPMGVVELAFLKQLQPHEIEFVKNRGGYCFGLFQHAHKRAHPYVTFRKPGERTSVKRTRSRTAEKYGPALCKPRRDFENTIRNRSAD